MVARHPAQHMHHHHASLQIQRAYSQTIIPKKTCKPPTSFIFLQRLLSSPSFIPLRLRSNAAPSRRHFPREINEMGRIKGRFLEASCRGCSVLVVWRVRMSRLAALKNLVAGPLANAKEVRLPCPLRTHQPIVLSSTQKIFMRRSLRSPGASQ